MNIFYFQYTAESLSLFQWRLKTSSDVVGQRWTTSSDVVEQRWWSHRTSLEVFGRPMKSNDAFWIFWILFFYLNNFFLFTVFLNLMLFSYKIMINIFIVFFKIINNFKIIFYFKIFRYILIDYKILIFWKFISYLSMNVIIDFLT